MQPHRFAVLLTLALALAALSATAGATHARAADCRHTDVVLYTTDTVNLANALGRAPSACADYWLTITPTAAGGPRNAPLPTLRGLGPRFHALPEVRLPLWEAYADAHGWYAAGVEFRRQMQAAGFDTSLDAWAVNETGEPSNTQAVSVIKGVDDWRQHVADLVRGLHDGPDGTPDPGLVFAADPPQITTDLTGYRDDLRAWYADAPFWQAMADNVRFWGQETYAGADATMVDGASLDTRAAYLGDYFLHGLRLAQQADSAALAFLESASTPIGNASYRYASPAPNTVGFGLTDIGRAGMLDFVAEQGYALRSTGSPRIGFAVVPKNPAAGDTLAVENRVAAVIQASESDAAGACGPDGSWCGASVAGAAFNDAWRLVFDITPPTIACVPTPDTLWPPNGKLVPVHVDVTVSDALSGPAGFTLTAADVDGSGFDVGTAAVDGQLRAQREGNGDGRVYTLTYTAADRAGNTAACTATVTVPHDQGT